MTNQDKALLEPIITSTILENGNRKFSNPKFATCNPFIGHYFFQTYYNVNEEFIENRRSGIFKVRLSFEIKSNSTTLKNGWMCLHEDWTPAIYYETELSNVYESNHPSGVSSKLITWLKNK